MAGGGLKIFLPKQSLRPVPDTQHAGDSLWSLSPASLGWRRAAHAWDHLTPWNWAERNFLEMSTWQGSSCLERGCEQFVNSRLLNYEGIMQHLDKT